MKKKILSLILSAAMVATATIVPVSAADVKDFADVAANSWYYDSVKFVAERDYMNGTSATTFSPDNNMTRAMFVTVMARVAGAQTDNSATTEFTDVPSGQWYTGAVQWGVEKGLVQGHGDGTFGTNDPITRQDTAVLAERFLKWYSEATGLTPETGSKVDSFTDASSISDYAKDSVEYCRQIGLLTGYEDGSFKPLKSITRAEAATILKRMTFLAEGVLTVTYTDENGKTVMMEVKEGDTFTVDPNGGKITYDGKTYDAEFTITVGTASLTLPAPTRSGYTFKGWKVTEAADGTPAFTAQWASSGGGGGGGSSVVAAETYTYQVLVDANKDDTAFDTFTSDLHEVNFDSNGNAINPEDVLLVDLAKEMVNNETQIKQVITGLNSTPFFKDGVAQEVTVKTIPAIDILPENTVQDIADGVDVPVNTVEDVIDVLDDGVQDLKDFRDSYTAKFPDGDVEKAIEVATEITQRLNEKVKDKEELENAIKKVLEDSLGSKVDQFYKATGMDLDDICGLAIEYAGKLNAIFGATGTSLMSDGDTGAPGGIEIKLNLVRTLINQYGDKADDYAGAKDIMEKALKEIIDDNDKINSIINNKEVGALIEACDPAKFFVIEEGTGENDKDKYSFFTADSAYDTSKYAGLINDIIDAANEARISLLKDEDIALTQADIANLIQKSVDKAKSYIDNEDQKSKLDKIAEKKDKLASLFMEDEPNLLDLLEIVGNEKLSYNNSVTFTLSRNKIDTIITNIFNRVGVDESEIDSSLIEEMKDKLEGNYTFSVNIEVNAKN